MTERIDLGELQTSLNSALRTLGDYATEFDDAVQGLSMPVGARAASMTIAAGILALIAELTELRAQAGVEAPFPCCGGSDEHPPEHTQDCGCDCGHELADHGGHIGNHSECEKCSCSRFSPPEATDG